MALSEREQQVLRDLEEQLHVQDPSLARSMGQKPNRLPALSPRHVGGGIALLLAGLAVVLGGVAIAHGVLSILVGLVGFAMAVGGVTLMLTTPRSRGTGRRGRASGGSSSRPSRGSTGSGFMDRQNARWDQRRDER